MLLEDIDILLEEISTFHYGSIKIAMSIMSYLEILLSTFHYGSIKISNTEYCKFYPHESTFHYGSIKMRNDDKFKIPFNYLHSTMVLLK